MTDNIIIADPNTILYVDACVEKWHPFTKVVDPVRVGRAAYLCESMGKSLQVLMNERLANGESKVVLGCWLKYVFPILLRMAISMPLKETDYDRVWQAAGEAFDEIFDPEFQGCVIRELPDKSEKRELLGLIVERAHASLLAYEKIVSRH